MLEGINYVACCHGQQKEQFLFSISCLCNTVINFVKCYKKVLWMHTEKLFHSLLNERVDSYVKLVHGEKLTEMYQCALS